MRNRVLVACAVLSVHAWGLCRGEEPQKVDLSLGAVSRVVWRGFDISPNNDSFAFQPRVRASLTDNLALDVQGTLRMDRGTKLDMATYQLNYSRPLALGSLLTIGYAHHEFSKDLRGLLGDKSGNEVCAKLAWPKLPFNPTLSLNKDFKEGSGLYAEISAIEQLRLLGLPIRAGTAIGYNDGQWIPGAGFSDIGFHLETDLKVSRGWTLSPRFSFVLPKRSGAAAVNDENEWILSWLLKPSWR